jgi:hypothetical protein
VYGAPRQTLFEGIRMHLVSSDAMDFTLYRIPAAEEPKDAGL